MNIVSKCRCGASIDIDAKEMWASSDFSKWLALHTECPQKMFTPHIAFKYLLRKASEK